MYDHFVCVFEKLLNVFAFAIFPVNNANTTACEPQRWTTQLRTQKPEIVCGKETERSGHCRSLSFVLS
jgi:hypothetical protein